MERIYKKYKIIGIFFLIIAVILAVIMFVKNQQTPVYFVYSHKSTSEYNISKYVAECKLKGGGGNVVKIGDVYYVVLVTFFDRQDAYSVSRNLKGGGGVVKVGLNNKNLLGYAKNLHERLYCIIEGCEIGKFTYNQGKKQITNLQIENILKKDYASLITSNEDEMLYISTQLKLLSNVHDDNFIFSLRNLQNQILINCI